MYILGIHVKHDASTCLLKDGKLLSFVEEERFERVKHFHGFPAKSIRYCLDHAGIGIADVDFVAVGNLSPKKSLVDTLGNYYLNGLFLKEELKSLPKNLLYLFDQFLSKNGTQPIRKQGVKPDQFYWCEHHLAHAASAFRCSPFEDSLILTMDAWGDNSTALIGEGRGNEITEWNRVKAPNSLGFYYSRFTEFLGYPYDKGHEAKAMGMAAYGKPNADFSDIIGFGELHYKVNPEYAFGKNVALNIQRKFGARNDSPKELKPFYSNIAATAQAKLEEVVIKTVNRMLREKKGNGKNLCLAGGVALNCKMNGEILKSGVVDDVFIQPSAGDAGKALGAALECYAAQGKNARIDFDHAYWGPEFSDEDIYVAIERYNQRYLPCRKINRVYQKDIAGLVAEKIANGKIIGWFQGRMEVGPRALGNRSIVADPSKAEVKDRINAKIKGREHWRPLCPSIKREAMEEYFGKDIDAPFMIMAMYALEEKRKEIEGVVHIDGTVRPQSVTKKQNPKYYELISEFEKISGIPLVLNTSFNYQEPIVCTPRDAIEMFSGSELDGVAIGNYYLEAKR